MTRALQRARLRQDPAEAYGRQSAQVFDLIARNIASGRETFMGLGQFAASPADSASIPSQPRDMVTGRKDDGHG